MAAGRRITLKQLDDALKEASKDVDFRPVLKAIRLDVIAETRTNFDKGTDPDGKTWAPLKHPRVSSKGGDLPLRDFGMLAASVTSPGSPGNIDESDEKSILWGTNFEHGPIHQFGGVITPKVAKMLAIPATREAQRIGSPRNWPDGQLEFSFGKKGGVAKNLRGEIQYYFARSVSIPKRPFLGVTEEKAGEYSDWVVTHAADEVAKRMTGGQ
jgi:phage gpG-like protein